MEKKEKQTETGDLAGMVKRGFADTDKMMRRGFTKNEEDHAEIAGGIQAILREVRETRGDVKDTKEMVKELVDVKDLRNRVERLEKKVGV